MKLQKINLLHNHLAEQKRRAVSKKTASFLADVGLVLAAVFTVIGFVNTADNLKNSRVSFMSLQEQKVVAVLTPSEPVGLHPRGLPSRGVTTRSLGVKYPELVLGETVEVGYSIQGQDLTSQIQKVLDSYIDQGKLIVPVGPRGERGGKGEPGQTIVNNNNGSVENENGKTTSVIAGNPVVTYIPPVPQNGFGGASLAGFTNLSADMFTGRLVTVTGGLTARAPVTFTSSANFATTSISHLQLGDVTGSLQCLHADTNGVVSGSGSDCGSGGGTTSPWTVLGSHVYYNTGNVGIGTTTPNASLTVTGQAGQSSPFFNINTTTGESLVSFLIDTSGDEPVLGFKFGDYLPAEEYKYQIWGPTKTGGGDSAQSPQLQFLPSILALDSSISGGWTGLNGGSVSVDTVGTYSSIYGANIELKGGNASVLDDVTAYGSNLTLNGGAYNGSYTAGSVELSAGRIDSSSDKAKIELEGSSGTSTAISGGDVTIQAGKNSNNSVPGGSIVLQAGQHEGTNNGGYIALQAGVGNNGNGGDVGFVGGSGATRGGNITLETGEASSGNSAGGDILYTLGLGSGSGRQGRIGIGTQTPTATLSLVGNAGSSPVLDFASSSGTSLFRINSNGNLGINTTTPGRTLTVVGDIRATGILYDSTNSAGTTGMVLQTTGSAYNWVATSTLGISGSLSGGTNGYAARWTSGSTLSAGVLIDNGTVAGVNATSSSYSFNISGTLNVTATSSFATITPTAIFMGGDMINDFVGTGLSLSGNTLQTTLGTDIGVAELQSADFGSFTCNGSACTLDNGSVNLAGSVVTGVLPIANGGTATTSSPSLAGQLLGAHTSGGWGIVNLMAGSNVTITTSTLGQITIAAAASNGNSAFTLGSGLIYNATSTDLVGIGTSAPTTTLFVQGKAGANPFAVASSTGNQLFTVLANGNVGIGTSTPSGALLTLPLGTTQANGISFGGDLKLYRQNSGLLYLDGNMTTVGYLSSTAGLYTSGVLNQNQVSGISYFSSILQALQSMAVGYDYNTAPPTDGLIVEGNVGVGTSTPLARLSVVGTSSAPTIALFDVASSTSTSVFRVTANGNIGINTTTPAQTLSVVGNMRLTGALFDATNASGTLGMVLQTTGTGTQWVATSTLGISGGALSGGTNGYLARWTSASALSSGISIDNGTVAGINATSSTITFNLQGNSGVSDMLNIASSSGVSVLRVTANQRVGIGSTSPTATLVVQGTSTNPTLNVFTVASSTHTALLTVASNGSTTIASLNQALPVRSTSGGSLFNGAIALGSSDVSGVLAIANGGTNATTATGATANLLFLQSGTGAVVRAVDSKLREEVSLVEFSCVGDGSTDDTTCFTNALAAAVNKTLLIPKPTSKYKVGPLTIPSNTHIVMESGAIVEAKTGFTAGQALVLLYDVSNVSIEGADGAGFQMLKSEYLTGEDRHCLAIRGSTNVYVRGIFCNDSGGDGLYIGEATTKLYGENVTVENSTFNNNRRQGFSLISGKNILIRGNRFTNTIGTDPQGGIDLEPNETYNIMKNVVLDSNYTYNNVGGGIIFSVFALDNTSEHVDVKIVNHHSESDLVGFYSLGAWSTGTSGAGGRVVVDNMYVSSSTYAGVSFKGYQNTNPTVTFNNLTLSNVNQTKGVIPNNPAIFIYRDSGGSEKMGNIIFNDPVIIDRTGTPKIDNYFYWYDTSGYGLTKFQINNPIFSGATNAYNIQTAAMHPGNLPFSTTPIFDATLGGKFYMSLTGNATSSTLSGAVSGQTVEFMICQDATGSRTFVWPTNVKGGMTINPVANNCSLQSFLFDGTNLKAQSVGTVVSSTGAAALTGYIGLNTTSPTATLFVQGVASSTNPFVVASSTGTQLLTVRANGNIGIGTSTPGHLITLSGGAFSDGASWDNASDRNLKENFISLDPFEILQKILDLNVQQWNYKSEDDLETHIGPTAQDFYAAFKLGNSSSSISTIDPAGIALLGIQALDQKILALQGSVTGNAESSNLVVIDSNNFSKDSVGLAKILRAATTVRVNFTEPYTYQPIVTITPLEFVTGSYRVTSVGVSGFTIELQQSQDLDITFNWHSFASPEAKLTVSDGVVQDIELAVTAGEPSVEIKDSSEDLPTEENEISSDSQLILAPLETEQPADVAGTSTADSISTVENVLTTGPDVSDSQKENPPEP